ncbi:hypothetical protein CBS147347_11201 [Aspergillus niger]|nr:hypothetical protein CBS147347_11201 [Aspergillus niger]
MGGKWKRWELERLCAWVAEQEEKGTKWSEREKEWRKAHGTPRSAAALRAQFLRLAHGWMPKCMTDHAQPLEPSGLESKTSPPSRHRLRRLRRKYAVYPTRTPRKPRRYRVNWCGSVIRSSPSPPRSTSSLDSAPPVLNAKPTQNVARCLQQPETRVPEAMESVGWPSDYISRVQSFVGLLDAMDQPREQYPSVQLFVGGNTKTQALRALYPYNNFGRSHRLGLARIHLSELPRPEPVVIVESGMQSHSEAWPRRATLPQRHHIRRSYDRSHDEVRDLLYRQVLLPLAHTVCFFLEDLASSNSVEVIQQLLVAWQAPPLAGEAGGAALHPHMIVVLTNGPEPRVSRERIELDFNR